MIDIKDLRKNPDKYRKGCLLKGITVDIDRILELDNKLRAAKKEMESLRQEFNALNKQTGLNKQNVKRERANSERSR